MLIFMTHKPKQDLHCAEPKRGLFRVLATHPRGITAIDTKTFQMIRSHNLSSIEIPTYQELQALYPKEFFAEITALSKDLYKRYHSTTTNLDTRLFNDIQDPTIITEDPQIPTKQPHTATTDTHHNTELPITPNTNPKQDPPSFHPIQQPINNDITTTSKPPNQHPPSQNNDKNQTPEPIDQTQQQQKPTLRPRKVLNYKTLTKP